MTTDGLPEEVRGAYARVGAWLTGHDTADTPCCRKPAAARGGGAG